MALGLSGPGLFRAEALKASLSDMRALGFHAPRRRVRIGAGKAATSVGTSEAVSLPSPATRSGKPAFRRAGPLSAVAVHAVLPGSA